MHDMILILQYVGASLGKQLFRHLSSGALEQSLECWRFS